MLAKETVRPVRSGLGTSKACLLFGLLALGCGRAGWSVQAADSERVVQRFETFLLGTRFELRLALEPERDGAPLAEAAFEAAEQVESLASIWDPNSEVTRLNAAFSKAEGFEPSASLVDLLVRCEAARELSGGAFDVTIGAWLELYGYYADEAGRPELPSQEEREATGRSCGADAFLFDGQFYRPANEGVQLDLGAVAKGLACERIGRVLSERNVEHYLVSAGASSIQARGDDPQSEEAGWPIDLDLGGEGADRVWLTDGALAVSGQLSEPFFPGGRLASHVLDPRTGHPVRHGTVRVVVFAGSAFEADFASTALMVMGSEVARNLSMEVGTSLDRAIFITVSSESESNELERLELGLAAE